VARRSQRRGYGWKRWSNDVVYGTWGLFRDYRIGYTRAKARTSRAES
jgi:RNA-directed DNA polymerase